MATTYKQLVNKVLEKLREDQLGGSDTIATDDYWSLIASFVNDAKEEVEDAWNWTDLRSTISVTTTNAQSELVLTGTNSRSKLFPPLYDTTNNNKIWPVSHQYYNDNTLITTQTNAPPNFYRRRGFSSGEIRVELYPIPDGVYTVKAYCKIPQAELTSESTELTLDNAVRPIVYRAWSMAIAERGEDGGAGSAMVDRDYRRYLTDAIQMDVANVQDEGHWEVV